MKTTLTNISPTDTKLVISLDEKDLSSVKKHVLNHFASKVKVPGFRAGTAPAAMVEKQIDQKAFMDEFLEHAINEFYRKGVIENDLRPVTQPKITVKKFVPYTLLEFDTEQEVIGKITLPDYKAIKLSKPKVEVAAKDVADIIKNIQARMAEKAEVARPIKVGDETIINFFGTDLKDEPVAGAEGKDYALTIGSKTFIPGFEEELIGLKTGESKDFKITFPTDYQAKGLQGKKVNFKVDIIKVNELIEPNVDDEFASKVGPFKTAAELKADIKKQITVEKKYQADREYEGQLVKLITEKSKVYIPDSLIDDQVMRSEEEEKRNLIYRGQTWEEHLKAEGITENQHRQRNRPEAEQRVRASLVLSEISEKEKVEITPAELDERIEILRAQYTDPKMQAELDKPENRQDIAARILTEKTLAKLKNYASK